MFRNNFKKCDKILCSAFFISEPAKGPKPTDIQLMTGLNIECCLVYRKICRNSRPRCSRGISGLCLLIAFLLIYILLRQSHSYTQTCHHSEAFQEGLHALADRVHRLLVTMGITHFLCYGSLWGQLRLGRTLPWERDIELCVLNEEMALKDEVFLERQFRKNNLQLVYDSTDGKYTVTDETLPDARVELIVFEEDPMVAMLRRVGWKRRVLPSDCESLPSLSCFPPRLVKTPLPSREFGGYIVPVPREGIEIQKYHYPDNWWKEILPKNC